MESPLQKPKKLDKAALISLSFELGYIIAIPLVVLALLGKWIDNNMHHTLPWVTLIGIVLAIASTTAWLTYRLKKYIK
ncbi:MAG: AtpZ/AtpI family protein [Candidatus Doudnabacteria bacterium]